MPLRSFSFWIWLVLGGASSFAESQSARVATFNAYLMPDLSALGYPLKLSPFNESRRRSLCRALMKASQGKLDVVLLQEVWEPMNRRFLKGCGFPHSLDLDRPKALLDSGLLILSRWPLSEGRRIKFAANGFPSKIGEDGEFLAKKSVYLARVHAPNRDFYVINTHLVSFYGLPDRYLKQRANQMETLAREVQSLDLPWVLGGDLNFSRGSPQWQAWQRRLPGLIAPTPAPRCTVCAENPLTDQGWGQLDYLFASRSTRIVPGQLLWEGLNSVGPGKSAPLSDHYGWQGGFVFP